MTDADASEPRSEPSVGAPRRRVLAIALLIACVVVIWSVDQAVKQWVVATLPLGESVPIVGEALQFHFVRNSGAAFSLASGATWIFSILATAVAIAIVWFAPRIRSVAWAVFFGLLLGGNLGNLTDRLFREPGFGVGHVIDFVYTPWLMPAIYNIADVAIVSSVVLFIVLTIRGVRIDGGRAPRRERSRGAVAAEAPTARPAEGTES